MQHKALVGLLLATMAWPAAAKDVSKAPKRSESMTALAACRAIVDASARLACFDREVAQLDEAERSNKVVVVDRADVETTRRGLFGFKLPSFGFLSGKGEPEMTQIDAVIASVGSDGDGRFRFTLEDGAHWRQIDNRPVSSRVRQGTKVTIKSAAFGSYFAIFEKLGSARVLRVNR
jgi:hypothetical protein